jgi:hypothetical protein
MIRFTKTPTRLTFEYEADFQGNGWVWRQLQDRGSVTISQVFHFELTDLLVEPVSAEEADKEGFIYSFEFASRDGEYFRIPGRVLDVDQDVLIVADSITFERRVFASERNISVFGRIAKLVPADRGEIVVGGSREHAIPIKDFKKLLAKFPNSAELDRYARARVFDRW